MRVVIDDAMFDVDNVYLGPPGHTLPISARYSAWVIGICLFMTLEIAEYQIGMRSLVWLSYTATAAALVTRWVMGFVDFDRPIFTIVRCWWNNVSTPREITKGHETTFRVPSLAQLQATPKAPKAPRAPKPPKAPKWEPSYARKAIS
jgi:hypothetical protein